MSPGRDTEDRRIRQLRPQKPYVNVWQAHGVLSEDERRPGGVLERTATVFLAGSECPFTCAFCDLWQYTIDGPTPVGAVPAQLSGAIESLGAPPLPHRIKLYNASNFFDRRAVPAEDLPRIAELCSPFDAVTVESHARLLGPPVLLFQRLLRGRLEIAMGLETVHPDALPRINKHLDLARFDMAAAFLHKHDIDVRVFVLLGAPHVPASESVEWTVRTARYAVERGAAVVSIIPVRGGNGEMERLQQAGLFIPPTRAQLNEVLAACADVDAAVVSADPWDLDKLPS